METRNGMVGILPTNEVTLIEVKNGRAVTSSLVVAEYFGKAHKDVLRAIKQLDCSTLFNRRNFALVEYIDRKGGEKTYVLFNP